jgi:hypothetical protein
MSAFHRFTGSFNGYGVASMQFGNRRARQLRSRGAAQEDVVAAVAKFELDMELLPRPEPVSTSAGSSLSFLLASGLSVCVICLLGIL